MKESVPASKRLYQVGMYRSMGSAERIIIMIIINQPLLQAVDKVL
jgi:hypothetical protein